MRVPYPGATLNTYHALGYLMSPLPRAKADGTMTGIRPS